MPRFRQRSLATQVRLALGGLALLTTLGSLGLLLLARRATVEAVEVYRGRLLPIQQLMDVADAYTVDITFALRGVRGGQMAPAQGLDVLSRSEARALRAWSRFKGSRPPSADLEAAEASLTRFRQLDRELEALLPGGPSPQLGIFGDAVWMPEVAALSLHLQRLREVEDHQAQVLIQELELQSRRTTEWGLLLLASVLALTLGFGGAFSARLRRDTRRLLAHLRRVADGNFEAVPVAEGGGELVWAERELNRTVARLRRLMADLQDQEARYRLLAERLPDVVYQAQAWPDGRRRWPFVSPQFQRFYGTDGSVLEEDPDYSLHKIHPEDRPGFVQALEEASRRLEPLDWEGRSFTERPGELKWVRVRRSPTPQADGSVLWDGVLEDITKLKQSEEALRLSEARAQEATRAKSAFLSNMSHELRTPLNAILGYAQLMNRRKDGSAEDRDQLARILGAGEHLLTLINDVLSLSKIESGGLEFRGAPFRVGPLLESVLDMQRPRAQAKGLELKLEVDPSLPANLEGDEAKLRQVLVNLLGNAVKFTSKGAVTLQVGCQSSLVSFAVVDTGPGISNEDQSRLFQPFYQAGNHPVSAEGTGLGLYISRSLVRLMGGDLTLQSRLGEGSCFRFSLPMPEGEAPLEVQGRGQVLGLAPGQREVTMLVVDDRLENRDLLAQMLASVGFKVLSAADGLEAVDIWRRSRPELIWMDLRMPRMSGFEALQIIRGQELEAGGGHTFVVAISASVIDLDRETLRQSGFDDFLGKPFMEAQLFEVIGRLLGLAFITRTPEPSGPALSSQDLSRGLSAQPEAWREALREALLTGDTEAALSMAERLDGPSLAQGLRQLIRSYKLQELLDLMNHRPQE
ncbi:MAG: ATP-binding protein [Geothrix sp.]|nr:ATP-binding protein [Geothrix sp.]